LPFIVASIFLLCRCGGGPKGDFGNRARLMLLTSGPTEIVLNSAKVPGYWAKPMNGEQEFFLNTQVRSYEKGSCVKVEGPLGSAYTAVYRDETGVYLSAYHQLHPTAIIVVWKISEVMVRKDGQRPSRKADR
jgi:hypothetical protein